MPTMDPKQTDASRIIDALGGTSEVAQLCEVFPSAVSQWRTDGIPRARMMFLRLARPDVFEKADHPAPTEAAA